MSYDPDLKDKPAAAEVGETALERENRLMNATIATDAVMIFELEKKLESIIDRCKRLTKDRSEIEAATIERCAQVTRDEPEAPGEMPAEFHLIPIEDAIRAAIRATKKSIERRIRALKDET